MVLLHYSFPRNRFRHEFIIAYFFPFVLSFYYVKELDWKKEPLAYLQIIIPIEYMETFILKWSCRVMGICWAASFDRSRFNHTTRAPIFTVIIFTCTIIVIIYTITTAWFATRCGRPGGCWCGCTISFLVQLFIRSITLWRWSNTLFTRFRSIRSLKYSTTTIEKIKQLNKNNKQNWM